MCFPVFSQCFQGCWRQWHDSLMRVLGLANVQLLPVCLDIEAAKACEILQAKHVVPIHHSTFPPLTGTPAQFQEEVKKRGLSTQITVLKPGQEVEV